LNSILIGMRQRAGVFQYLCEVAGIEVAAA
jgi:hypothetical protein